MNISHSILKAYLRSELSEEENKEVQQYLADHIEDPDIQELLDNWFDDCRVMVSELSSDALMTTRSRLGIGSSNAFKVFKWAGISIAILALVVVSLKTGFELYRYSDHVEWNEMYVPYGETRNMTLPDGTQLTLDAGSRITWPSEFRGSERSVFLEGQVTAVVAKDSLCPFVIHSRNVDVQVLGTTFNFKSYREDAVVELMLLEGRVSMNISSVQGNREICLTPGDIAQYNTESSEVSVAKLSPENFELLSNGGKSFCFINLPLGDIVAELERSFGVKIVIVDDDMTTRRFLAMFTNEESLEEMLHLLAVNGDFKVKQLNGTIYIN